MTHVSAVPEGRTPYVFLDFCFYAYCNFTCTYCRASNDEMSRGQGRDAVERTLAEFLRRNSAGVLKLSGYGEATLWPELPDIVRAWAPHFPVVQLISNGAGSHELLERLCEVANFQAAITLDGHTSELDRFRTKRSVALHRRVVETISWLVARGTKVEINCVISKANAGALDTYTEWVRETWGAAVRLIPLPVRPTMGRTMADIEVDLLPTDQDIDRVERCLVHRHAEFSDVLAPLPYLTALVRFMRLRHRGSRCHIHRANFGVNTTLQALACACAGDRLLAPLGPVAAVGVDDAIERRRRDYLVDGSVGAKCSTCFTHYDIVNLYYAGAISADELRTVPSLSDPAVVAHVNAIKREIAPYLTVAVTGGSGVSGRPGE